MQVRWTTLGVILAIVVLAGAKGSVHDDRPIDKVCSSYRDVLSNLILKFLDKLRTHMSTGIPSLGIPPLDPLAVGNESVRLKRKYQYDVTGRIGNSKLEGLHAFNVTSISTSILHMQANVSLTIPFLFLTGTYDLKGKALQFVPVKGSGTYVLKPYGVYTSVVTVMELQNSHVQVKSMDFKLVLEGVFAKFNGLFGGGALGNLANSIMNRFGIDVFRLIEPKVHQSVRDGVVQEINKVLKDIPLADLISLNNNLSCHNAIANKLNF